MLLMILNDSFKVLSGFGLNQSLSFDSIVARYVWRNTLFQGIFRITLFAPESVQVFANWRRQRKSLGQSFPSRGLTVPAEAFTINLPSSSLAVLLDRPFNESDSRPSSILSL